MTQCESLARASNDFIKTLWANNLGFKSQFHCCKNFWHPLSGEIVVVCQNNSL
jgi:hypothetical protein